MKVLAIETSCDDTSAAVVESRDVLGICTISRLKDHANFGGVVPEIASRHHEESILSAVSESLKQANLDLNDIDAVAVTSHPGLVGSILVGTSFAKGVSLALGLPLIEVDHILAHACSPMIEHKDLNPPFLSLVISGGHTSILNVKNLKEYEVCCHSVDDAVGEVYDKVARSMGIPYPGGAELDKMALIGDPFTYKMPVPKIDNFSFSGIKTWALNISKNISESNRNDLASSLVYGISNYVSDKVIKILNEFNYDKITIGGGVACSKVLRQVLSQKLSEESIKAYFPSPKFCSDNAGMIGLLA